MSEAGRRGDSRCVYCGDPAYGYRTCRAHRGLETLEPSDNEHLRELADGAMMPEQPTSREDDEP